MSVGATLRATRPCDQGLVSSVANEKWKWVEGKMTNVEDVTTDYDAVYEASHGMRWSPLECELVPCSGCRHGDQGLDERPGQVIWTLRWRGEMCGQRDCVSALDAPLHDEPCMYKKAQRAAVVGQEMEKVKLQMCLLIGNALWEALEKLA